jgi:uncharacterized membrane protein
MTKRRVALLLFSSLILSITLSFVGPTLLSLPLGIWSGLFLPGTLLLLGIKRKVEVDWNDIAYCIGLGIFFLIFASLFINWLLRTFGVERPLTHTPFMISIAFSNMLLFVSYPRWKNNPVDYKYKKITNIEKIFGILASLLCMFFIIGALRLNNGASGVITQGCYVGAAIIFIALMRQLRNLRSSVLIYTLWLIGLGVFLSGWLRSGYVAGPDISAEYQVFNLVHSTGYWSIGLYRQAYNACLSVSLLPVALVLITKLSGTLIFKLVIPFLYSFLVPIVFLITKKFLNKGSASIAAFFFISQPAFFSWWWIPIRQEVAFLFFGLVILVMANTSKKEKAQTTLLITFIIGMVVSHYSTSYLALTFFALLNLIFLVWKLLNRNISRPAFLPSPIILALTFLTVFAWYSQITFGFNGFEQFLTRSFSNAGQIFNDENQAQGQSLFGQFNVFDRSGTSTFDLKNYEGTSADNTSAQFGANNLYPNTKSMAPQQVAVSNETSNSDRILTTRSIVIQLGKLIVVSGVVYILYSARRKSNLRQYSIMCVSGLLLLAFIFLIPFFSLDYDLVRTFQQALIVLGGTVGIGYFISINSRIARPIRMLSIIFVAVYFILVSNLPFLLIHSYNSPMALTNYGSQYNYYYVQDSDYYAAHWLGKTNAQAIVVGDRMSQYKLRLGSSIKTSNSVHGSVFPQAISRQEYVFADSINTSTGIAFDNVRGGTLTYQFPFNFLDSNKNKIYVSGQTIIYK